MNRKAASKTIIGKTILKTALLHEYVNAKLGLSRLHGFMAKA